MRGTQVLVWTRRKAMQLGAHEGSFVRRSIANIIRAILMHRYSECMSIGQVESLPTRGAWDLVRVKP